MRSKTQRLSTVLLALALALPAVAAAQYEAERLGPLENRGVLRTTVGSGLLVTLPGESERVAVADEAIATVHVLSDREVLLNGTKPGQTTVFVWLTDGRRLRFLLRVTPDLGQVAAVLQDVDPSITIEPTVDGRTVILRGEVDDEATAREAEEVALSLLGGGEGGGKPFRVVNLLKYLGATPTADERLQAALAAIDPRIEVRRIQVGDDPNAQTDAYVLEGHVETLADLKRAVTLAELQLGEKGGEIKAPGADRVTFNRIRGIGIAGAGGGGGGVGSGVGALGFLTGSETPPPGLASQLARDLVVTSGSGRVISFLEVDELHQILVSIRVLEVNRAKARKLGINWRFDSDHISLGGFSGPQVEDLPSNLGRQVSVSDISGGNLVGAFVDQMSSVVLAIDFLQDKELARSVAEPNILTLSGEQATVLVGGEIPVPTTTTTQVAAVQGFFFQDFGVRLDIRPTLAEDGIIALEVAPSIVKPNPRLGVEGVPGFQVQTVQTTARVKPGESLVLGGLLSFEEGSQENRVPGLGVIPLFRWKRRSRAEQELLFVITPEMVDIGEEAEPVPLDAIELPELDWPKGRKRWRDDFEPGITGPDGIPPAFQPQEEIERPVFGGGKGEAGFSETLGTYQIPEEPEELEEEPPSDGGQTLYEPPPAPARAEKTMVAGGSPSPTSPPPGVTEIVASERSSAAVSGRSTSTMAPEPRASVRPARTTTAVAERTTTRSAARPTSTTVVPRPVTTTVRPSPSLSSDDEPTTSPLVAASRGRAERDAGASSSPAASPSRVRAGEPVSAPPPAQLVVLAHVDPCVNLRTGPSLGSDTLGCLPPGTQVESLEEKGQWCRIRTAQDLEGWSVASFFGTREDGGTGAGGGWTVLATARPCLQLRSEPQVTARQLECVEPGTPIEVLEQGGEWKRVRLADGREGWMASAYLGRS